MAEPDGDPPAQPLQGGQEHCFPPHLLQGWGIGWHGARQLDRSGGPCQQGLQRALLGACGEDGRCAGHLVGRRLPQGALGVSGAVVKVQGMGPLVPPGLVVQFCGGAWWEAMGPWLPPLQQALLVPLFGPMGWRGLWDCQSCGAVAVGWSAGGPLLMVFSACHVHLVCCWPLAPQWVAVPSRGCCAAVAIRGPGSQWPVGYGPLPCPAVAWDSCSQHPPGHVPPSPQVVPGSCTLGD